MAAIVTAAENMPRFLISVSRHIVATLFDTATIRFRQDYLRASHSLEYELVQTFASSQPIRFSYALLGPNFPEPSVLLSPNLYEPLVLLMLNFD